MAFESDVHSWLSGLAEMGCTFMRLKKGEKRTDRKWKRFRHCVGRKGLHMALGWLEQGYGVGILLGPSLWVFDADNQVEAEGVVDLIFDSGAMPLMVSTPSLGAHFYFRYPEGFTTNELKNHLLHPCRADGSKMVADFKLGQRTLVVAPGTVLGNGSYKPASQWFAPPVMDPGTVLPDGRFWHLQKHQTEKDRQPFLTNTRPVQHRLMAAKGFLKTAEPSVSGAGGSKALRRVCEHLVGY